MHALRERLQELADAATRDGAIPGPAHALRRGRQRRRRIAGGVAALLVMTLAAGAVATGRLADRPTLPPTAPATTVPLPAGPKVSRDLPGGRTTEDMAFEDLSTELRRCPDRTAGKAELIGYVRSREWRRMWMVAARPPAPGASGLCWTSGLFSGGGAGSFSGVSSTTSAAIPLTASGSGGGDFATIEGQVTKRAVRVRVGFRDGRPPLDLPVIQAGHRYPVNFYFGIFAGSAPRSREWPPAEVAAFDAEGRQVAACTIGPPWNPASACPAD
jgi:hypothetical protein